jgi:hypothetical protein
MIFVKMTRLRRIPVVDQQARIVGIITQGDIAIRLKDPQKIAEVVVEISNPAWLRKSGNQNTLVSVRLLRLLPKSADLLAKTFPAGTGQRFRQESRDMIRTSKPMEEARSRDTSRRFHGQAYVPASVSGNVFYSFRVV